MAKVFYDDGSEEAKDYVEWQDMDGVDHVDPDHNVMLAKLLVDEDVFVSGYDGSLCVICSDTFAYAGADCIELNGPKDIVDVYEAKNKHGWRGVALWCCLKRKERPLPPIERDMRDAGVWDASLDELHENGKW